MSSVKRCSSCGMIKQRSSYSKTQLKKSARRCKQCISNSQKQRKVNTQKTKLMKSMQQQPAPQMDSKSGQSTALLAEYAKLSEERCILLGYGYCGRYERKYKIAIPYDIINLFIRYIGGLDEWDKEFGCSHLVNFDDDDRTIIHKSHDGKFCTAYLSNIVQYGRHCWSFKIKAMKGIRWSIIIGIWNIESINLITQNYPFNKYQNGYAYFVYDAVVNDPKRPYYTSMKAKDTVFPNDGNDIISMVVDLDQHEINWRLNGKLQFDQCAFNDVKHGKYRAVVTLTQNHNTVQLLSYQQLN